MSGKPYSIGELKIIVDYLVENKFYGEIKARKMWMDFANTKLTSRTWQSLKETFLKRILPDIHNPYFKLTNEQISSFRARRDLSDKTTNKLEIHTISDDSNSNGHNPKDNVPSNNEGETTTGENVKCSKPLRSRSSADTVILENCYETAEEIQKELESKVTDEKPAVNAVSKSLRDCITYSEPLTPMLQEVLDDFASEPEDSDREGQMEIVDSVPENENSEDVQINQNVPETQNETTNTLNGDTGVVENGKGLSADIVEEALANELEDGNKAKNKTSQKQTNDLEELPVANLDEEISSMHPEVGTEKDDDHNAETVEALQSLVADCSKNQVVQDSENPEVITIDSHSDPQDHSADIGNSNSTVDASLPNNPEALKNNKSKNVEANNKKALEDEVSKTSDKIPSPMKATKKRSFSEDNSRTLESKKKKLEIKLKSPLKTDKKADTECDIDMDTNGKDAQLKSNTAIIKKPWLEDNSGDVNKPSTSFETHVVDIIESERNNTKEASEITNPCLQNISLFDEQFNKNDCYKLESSDTEENKKKTKVDTQKPSTSKGSDDVVVLKSCSESDIQTSPVIASPKKKHRAGVLSTKSERRQAISNMFGFTSGEIGSRRKRQLSRRRRTVSHNNTSQQNAGPDSNSSEWSSESENEEFVSPPRGRKNRSTKKYRKPHSVKISSLEEDGGLFVMYGKKIYPIVKDGKIVKNYVTYLPESDSEEGESFWKQKYVEEKQKAAELKKLLEIAKEPQQLPNANAATAQTNPTINPRPSLQAEPSNGVGKEVCLQETHEKKEETKVNAPEKIKIKFTKNNEEVQLEGHWPQIHPVLEQVVQIFHKDMDHPVSDKRPSITTPSEHKEPSSGISSPIIITAVDPEVHEKVNKIEKEIFEEIEERDKEEQNEPNGVSTNVTTRKMGRPQKSSSSTNSPVKQPKISNGPEATTEENGRTRGQKAKETENKVIENKEITPKRQTRPSRKVLNEMESTNASKPMQTRRSSSRQKLDTSKTNDEDDDDVKYMLPPKIKRLSLNNKKTKSQKSSEKAPKMFSSPDNLSLNSMDSTQGYQDSDMSPVRIETRKKKRIDTSSFVIKTRNSLRRSMRRNSHPYLHCDAYNDSSNSSIDAHVKTTKVTRDNSSMNTEAYRSESYQLLNPQAKVSLRQLEPIDETSPIDNETFFVNNLKSVCRNEISAQINNNFASQSGQMTSDIGSSSNVSLPMSPELSVVENMSISKEMLNSIEDFPTINEMQCNDDIKETTMCSKFMITDVDVSVPLMNQECEFERCNTVTEVSTEPKSLVTESLINKIDNFNINDQVTPTDTLDKKLHDLLLESGKKTAGSQNIEKKDSMMDVDVTSVVVQKKAKNKKRCSTPQKRKGTKKSVAPKVDPVVEEEHVESCSHSGRKSCPPLLQTYLCDDNVINEEINIANLTIANANEKPKARKKKDIIRVKIQRPKNKKAAEKLRAKSTQNASRISIFTDSGINESELQLALNDSVDLIHNHSETCLHANECVGDSIEFVENSRSVITLGDSMQSGDNAWNSRSDNNDDHSTTPDLFCNNAQDISFYNRANADNMDSTSETVYHSPLGTEASPNSLITEDLSDDLPPTTRPTKWYLLSEDETNSANIVGQESTMLNSGNFRSNLNQLFPITCAIPDLSTITELSRENDNSRKPTLEDLGGLTGDDFNSLSVFDSDF